MQHQHEQAVSDIYLSLRRLCSYRRIPKKTSFVLFALFVRHHRPGGRTLMIFAQRYNLRQAHDSDLHGRVRLQSNRCNLLFNYFKAGKKKNIQNIYLQKAQKAVLKTMRQKNLKHSDLILTCTG